MTADQLLDAGFSRNGIARLVARGYLHRVYRGVYAVGRPPMHAYERAASAVLAAGPTAALSHLPALALWDLAGWPASLAEVVVTTDRRPRGVKVHLCPTTLPRDFRRRHGIRVTSPARTMLDCAPRLTERARTRAVNDAIRAKDLKTQHIRDVVDRNPKHPGAPLLRPFVEIESPTRSDLEDDFLKLCARYGLPTPMTNSMGNGYELDAYFEAEQLIVEVDGYDFHNDRDAFERDRLRDADALEAAGTPTLRITKKRMSEQPGREAKRLHTILARRRAELSRGSEPEAGCEPPA